MRLPIDLIQQYCNPFEHCVWHGMETPVTRAEIEHAINARKLRRKPVPTTLSEAIPRSHHIERIAYLVVHGWTDAIDLECGYGWLVQDGNHRLAAAIYRGDTTIEAVFFGFIRDVADMFGGDIAKQAEADWEQNESTG